MMFEFSHLLRPALFVAGGAAAGYLFYRFFGCTSG